MDPRGLADLKANLRQLLYGFIPGLRGGYVYQRLARVLRVGGPGGEAGLLDARYTADVQPLRPDGADDPVWPAILGVPLPQLWVGPQRGIMVLPCVGAVLRLGFLYGDPSCPYLAPYSSAGFDVPSAGEAEIVISQGISEIRIAPDGTITLGGAGAAPLVKEGVLDWAGGHSHPSHGAPPTQPIPPGLTTSKVVGL